MDPKLSFLLVVACATAINGAPINTEADTAEYGDFFEGDIVLTEGQMSSILYSHKRNGAIDVRLRWPEGIVYYEIAPAFNVLQVAEIQQALKMIEMHTCVRFHPRTETTVDYIHVQDDPTGCYSNVGRVGGRQILNLQNNLVGLGCFKFGTIMHEFIHALGFFHQQSATERDDYVRISYDNIQQGMFHNFDKYPSHIVTEFGVRYDYGSIMHFGAYAFSKNGLRTIIPLDVTAVIGQRVKMSDSDILKINRMYKCPGF